MDGPTTPGVWDNEDARYRREAGARFLRSIGHAIDDAGPQAPPYAPIMGDRWRRPDEAPALASVDARGPYEGAVWERTASGGDRTLGSLGPSEELTNQADGWGVTNQADGWGVTNQADGWKITNNPGGWKITNNPGTWLENHRQARIPARTPAHVPADRPFMGTDPIKIPLFLRKFYQAMIFGFMRVIARHPFITAFVAVPVAVAVVIWALPFLLIVMYVLGLIGGVSAFIWYKL